MKRKRILISNLPDYVSIRTTKRRADYQLDRRPATTMVGTGGVGGETELSVTVDNFNR